ncbi:MAG: hypothetical protein K2F80_01675 [Muribaculaceae bacterium]|nr:hypothetical protein [Muribaculaceae bacterium]
MVKEFEQLPVSFRIIGIGEPATKIIENVKSYGFECVAGNIVTSPEECIPTDEDKMVIVVTTDNNEVANVIAKKYHEAGVLTIGLGNNGDLSCYDSVMRGTCPTDYPEIIKSLIQPVIMTGYICYDFNDLCSTLRDSGNFMVKNAMGDSIEACVANIKGCINNLYFKGVKYISLHLYFNMGRPIPIELKDIAILSEMISSLPETVNVIWSAHFDDSLKGNQVRLDAILAGKGDS